MIHVMEALALGCGLEAADRSVWYRVRSCGCVVACFVSISSEKEKKKKMVCIVVPASERMRKRTKYDAWMTH